MWKNPQQIRVEMMGKFPPTVLPSLYHENVLATTCHRHSTISTYVCLLCVDIITTGKLDGYFDEEISPTQLQQGIQAGTSTEKTSHNFTQFPGGIKGKNPWGRSPEKFPIFPCGYMGGLDGMPAGHKQYDVKV
mgnify:FL=1